MTEKRAILLTGVTGALGKEIVKELLKTTDDRLYLLIRPRPGFSPCDRARKMLADWGLEELLGTRVHVLAGDVTKPYFGLQEFEMRLLKEEVTNFFHIAAVTALNGKEESCNAVNVEGTENALDIAWSLRNEGKMERFDYFSTAYVPGSLKDCVSKEDELPEMPAHANHYEASKYNAEKTVRRAMHRGLPVAIFRPSIVVGESKSGAVSEFNVIYPFLKLFASGMIRRLPADPEDAFNIVPLDFVIKASLAISRRADSIGKTYHLVSEDPPTLGMLLELKDKEFPQFPSVELVFPEDFDKDKLDPAEQLLYAMMKPYMGYLRSHMTFDTTNTRKALQNTGISQPATDYQFLKVLVQYGVDQGYFVAPQTR